MHDKSEVLAVGVEKQPFVICTTSFNKQVSHLKKPAKSQNIKTDMKLKKKNSKTKMKPKSSSEQINQRQLNSRGFIS